MFIRRFPCVVVARPAASICLDRGKAAIALTAAVLLNVVASAASGQVVILPASGPEPSPQVRRPYAINDGGTVVGYTEQIAVPTVSEPVPVQWSGPGFVANILPRPAGAPSGGRQISSANGINNNGVVVGQVAWPIGGPNGLYASHAVRWEGGVPTDLGTVPGFDITSARAINNTGQIAGFGFNGGFGGTTLAVRWTPVGVLQPMDRLPMHNESIAFDINASGRIVGYSGENDGDASPERRPVAWDGTTPTELSSPAGYNHGEARSINDAGSIVGSSGFFDIDIYEYADFRATQWTGGVPTLLPLLAGFAASSASSINADGLSIGACYADSNSAWVGFGGVPVLWNNGGVTDLRPLLEPFFAAESTFTVTDINSVGQITGFAVNFTGTQGFVLTIPAPGTTAVLGLVGLASSRRRRN